jgi:lipoprotein NlpD
VLARILLSLVLCSIVACGGNSRAPVEDRAAHPQYSAYTVKSGDTLYSISFRYGLDFRKVAAANGIVAPYTIYPGQKIELDEAARPAVTVAPRVAPASTPIVTHGTTHATKQVTTHAATGAITQAPAPASSSVSPGYRTIPVPGQASSPAYPSTPESVTAVPVAPVPSVVTPGYPAASEPVPTPAPAVSAPVADVKPSSSSQNYVGGDVKVWLWPTSGAVTRGYSESVHKGIDIGGARGDAVVAVAAGKVVYAGTGIVGFGELLIIKHNEVYLSAYGHNDSLLVAEGQTVTAGQKIAEKGSSGTDTVKLHFEIRKEGKPIDPQRLLPRR